MSDPLPPGMCRLQPNRSFESREEIDAYAREHHASW